MLVTSQVYLNLDAMMLPFDGLLNLLLEGWDLFFFSSQKALLEMRLGAFSEYLETNLGKEKALLLWEYKVFAFEKSRPPKGALTLKRLNSFILQISCEERTEIFCLAPRPKYRFRETLLGENLLKEKKEKNFFLPLAEVFFDKILNPLNLKTRTRFPCLAIYRLFLWEVEAVSAQFRESYETILGSLKQKKLFLSISKKSSHLIKNFVSEEDLFQWLFDNFGIQKTFAKKDVFEKNLVLTSEYVVLRFKLFLCLLMILFVEKGSFSTFKESSSYLKDLFAIKDESFDFESFSLSLGEEKFNYLVWQFFPEFIETASFFPWSPHAFQISSESSH